MKRILTFACGVIAALALTAALSSCEKEEKGEPLTYELAFTGDALGFSVVAEYLTPYMLSAGAEAGDSYTYTIFGKPDEADRIMTGAFIAGCKDYAAEPEGLDLSGDVLRLERKVLASGREVVRYNF